MGLQELGRRLVYAFNSILNRQIEMKTEERMDIELTRPHHTVTKRGTRSLRQVAEGMLMWELRECRILRHWPRGSWLF